MNTIHTPSSLAASDLFVLWRPIGTAPKDGTHILAHDGNEYFPPTVVHWFQSAWYLSVCPDDVDNEYQPTCWLMAVDWPNRSITQK